MTGRSVCSGVLTSTAAVQQLHRTSTRRRAAASSSTAPTDRHHAGGALDRLKAFSSIRRQPTVPIPAVSSVGLHQNGSGGPPAVSSPPVVAARHHHRPNDVDLKTTAAVFRDHRTLKGMASTPLSRNQLQISRSYHDMPQCYTVQEQDDQGDNEEPISSSFNKE